MKKSIIIIIALVVLVLMLNWLSGCANQDLKRAVITGKAVVEELRAECQCDDYDDLLAKIGIFEAMLDQELPTETIDKILAIADELCEQFDEPEIRLHIRIVVAILESMKAEKENED